MNKRNLSKALIAGILAASVLMPVSTAQAADPGKYKACVQSCQSQYAACYRQTKNRAQCQEQQANCSKGCASYLSSLKDRVLAMVKAKMAD